MYTIKLIVLNLVRDRAWDFCKVYLSDLRGPPNPLITSLYKSYGYFPIFTSSMYVVVNLLAAWTIDRVLSV